MPSIDELTAAGRRAAEHPVPPSPPFADLEQRASRQRRRRRVAGSAAATVALLGIGVPVGLGLTNSTPIETVAAGAPSAETTGAAAISAVTDEAPADGTNAPVEATDTERTIEISLGDDVRFSARIISGDGAADAAAAAEAAADEVRSVDDVTIWIERNGDDATASAIVDNTFVSVTGPSSEIDRIIELVIDGTADGFELPEIPTIPRLDDLEGGELGEMLSELLEHVDGLGVELGPGLGLGSLDDLDLETFLSELEQHRLDLEQLLGDLDLDGFDPEQLLEGLDLDGLGLDGLDVEGFDLDRFLDGESVDLEGLLGELFDGTGSGLGSLLGDRCISIEVSGSDGADVDLEIPEGCASD